ncbi:MAG: DNA-binding transcriptional regulator Fis [Gammaproteobacteria bacterium]|nr:DNA-binding transcriptional regulator Fis [Gammaproteobacteria bacterium]
MNSTQENNTIEKNKEGHSSILRNCVCSVLENYIKDIEGHTIESLYQLVMEEVETPLLETIMKHTNGNQSQAAKILGINRGTLRKKLKQYNITE